MENRWSYETGQAQTLWRRQRPDAVGCLLFCLPAGAGFWLDLWSKQAVFSFLADKPFQQAEIVKGFLNFIVAENSGAAFSIAKGQREILTGISIAAIVVIAAIFLFGGARRRLTQAAMGLMTAGIAGNLYDRLFNEGCVRDFIDVYASSYHWPTFNAADSFLCIGTGLLIIVNFTSSTAQRQNRPQTEAR